MVVVVTVVGIGGGVRSDESNEYVPLPPQGLVRSLTSSFADDLPPKERR